jgi:hypothetical protein
VEVACAVNGVLQAGQATYVDQAEDDERQ